MFCVIFELPLFMMIIAWTWTNNNG